VERDALTLCADPWSASAAVAGACMKKQQAKACAYMKKQQAKACCFFK